MRIVHTPLFGPCLDQGNQKHHPLVEFRVKEQQRRVVQRKRVVERHIYGNFFVAAAFDEGNSGFHDELVHPQP